MLCSQGGYCSLCCVHKMDVVVYVVFTGRMLYSVHFCALHGFFLHNILLPLMAVKSFVFLIQW